MLSIACFCAVLYLRAHGEDRPGLYEERHAIDRRIHFDHLAALVPLVGLVIIPSGTGGQIDGALGMSPLRHRHDEEGGAEHIGRRYPPLWDRSGSP